VVDAKADEPWRGSSPPRPRTSCSPQWPIDTHMDHQAASTLTFRAWLAGGRQFELYYYEVTRFTDDDFHPTDYVDITAVREKKKAALFRTRARAASKYTGSIMR